jgi:hypothetical protein
MQAENVMRKSKHRQETMRSLAYALALIGCTATGCDRASPNDPDPPAGGQKYVMSYDVFTNSIDPILSSHGCDNLNCHGGGIRGTFQLSPANDKDPAFDYQQASLQVYGFDPPESPLVMKPLAEECGGATHGGGAFFFSLDDPDYVAILTWIEAGEYQ